MTDKKEKDNKFKNHIDSPTFFFSLYSAWTLAIIFIGQSLGAHALKMQIEIDSLVISLTLISTIVGLITTGFFIKSLEESRRIIKFAIIISIVGTVVFLFKAVFLWRISLIILSFVTGVVIACWGGYFQQYKTSKAKLQSAANIIVYSNIGMIVINVISLNVSTYLGIIVSILILFFSLFVFLKSEKLERIDRYQKERNKKDNHIPLLKKSLILLYVFIALITVDSGMMYQIVNPAFSHHTLLTSFYWAIPYIGTIFLLKKLPEKINKSYILYLAVAMIGFAYILFYLLDRSALSYILINTVMLGAFGVCDLFWWVILGEMLAFTKNPIKIFGVGLSANVLGVFFGYAMSHVFMALPEHISAFAALGIVLVSLLALPKLYDGLSRLIKNQAFLIGLTEHRGSIKVIDSQRDEEYDADREINYREIFGFTGREEEIAQLLLGGRTYKMIAQELFISENTVKTHIKNIYSKMNVVNKTEFIEMMKITQN